MIMTGMLVGCVVCSVLLARRLIAMLWSSKPYWGGSATEGYIDKTKQPWTHAFYVSVTAFAFAVSISMGLLFLWAVLQQH